VTALGPRIYAENRRLIVTLAVAAVVNAILYVLVVNPLARRSAGAAERATVAAQARQNAERDLQAARALITGKAKAEEELNAFYRKVLPANGSAARRMTYVPIVEIARRNNVEYVNRTYESEAEEIGTGTRGAAKTSLMRLTTRVVLQGDYEDLRAFIYELERASEFVVIDDVTLIEAEENEPVTLTIHLSTFYVAEGNA
jgi:hypothetical protein